MAEYNPEYLNTQLTTTAGAAPLFQPAVNRYVILNAKEHLVFNRFGQRIKVPKGKTKTISFDKCSPLPISTTALTEGVTPEGESLEVSRVNIEPRQFGKYVATSDQFDFFKHDPSPGVLKLAEKLSNNGAETMDLLTKMALDECTNEQYAGGRATKTAVTSSDVLTVKEIRKAVRTLTRNKAERVDDSWVCIIDADMQYDIQDDEAWEKVKDYDPKDMYAGEIGRLYGVRFVLSTQDLTCGESTDGSTLHCAYILGKNAYGCTSPDDNLETIWHDKGSGGTADPLNQRSTAGWKAYHAAKVLVDEWMVKIICAASE